jgi:outer membrane protein, multidrug efflux system
MADHHVTLAQVSFNGILAVRHEQDRAVAASREALAIAEFRYTSGLTSYLEVLDAQRTLLGAEVAQSRTLGAQLIAVVQLYRALGGGWSPDGEQAPRPSEPR